MTAKMHKLRPSPAMIVALISLFVALSGGAYAVTAKKNSVKSSSIKNGQVLNPDIGNGAVTKPKLGADVNSAFLPASAASSFLPSSSVKRIGFSRTTCGDASPSCDADPLVKFGNVSLATSCGSFGGTRSLWVAVRDTSSYNVALVRDNLPTEVIANAGGSGLIELSGTDNVVGTIVIEKGNTSQEITIPFHAYVGPGTAPDTAACVFEGTGTTA